MVLSCVTTLFGAPAHACREVSVLVFDSEPVDPDWAHVSILVHCFLRQVGVDEDDPMYANLFETLRISREH